MTGPDPSRIPGTDIYLVHLVPRWDDAIADHRAAIDAEPSFADALNSLGAALHETHRDEEAIEALRARFLYELCNLSTNEVSFYVGNQAKRAHTFSVLGVYYPKFTD